jgi:hypothetical protein
MPAFVIHKQHLFVLIHPALLPTFIESVVDLRFTVNDKDGGEMSWRANLSRNMRELRVVLCQTGENSNGAR